MAEVVLKSLSKTFGTIEAIKDMSLTIEDGSFVVLLGPTGAGKTTLLRCVAGLETPQSGTIEIGGADMFNAPPAARDVTFVFQQYSLYPHLTVFENLAFPLRLPALKIANDVIDKRVREIASLLHISEKLDNKATMLSGGEMQRVAIGRALVRKPSVYLMDEPLSSLDAKLRAELRLELKRIQVELGATILYVTHDQIEAMTMATKVGVMSEGRLVQFGSPREIYEDPDDIYVATRLGTPRINILPADIITSTGMPENTAYIGARTEHLTIHLSAHHAGKDGIAAEVDRIEHLGDQTHLHAHIGDMALTVLVDAHSDVKAGDKITLELKSPLYFDKDGRRVRLSTGPQA